MLGPCDLKGEDVEAANLLSALEVLVFSLLLRLCCMVAHAHEQLPGESSTLRNLSVSDAQQAQLI